MNCERRNKDAPMEFSFKIDLKRVPNIQSFTV